MLRLAAALVLAGASGALAASAPVQRPTLPIERAVREARNEAAAADADRVRLEKQAADARDGASRLQALQLAGAQAIAAAEARITAADAQGRRARALVEAQRRRLTAGQAPMRSLLAGLALTARRPPILAVADRGSAEELVKLQILVRSIAPAIEAKTADLSAGLDRARLLEQQAGQAERESLAARDELAGRLQAFAELEARVLRLAERSGSEALGAGDVAIARGEQASLLEGRAAAGRSALAQARELAALGPAPIARQTRAAPAPAINYRLPADAAVIDGLGAISSNGIRSRGLTLATRRGSPLVAPASGIILFAGPFGDYDGVVIIDHGGGWKSVLVNAGTRLARGAKVRPGDPLGIALGQLEVQLQRGGEPVSPALIAGSSQMLSNR